MRYQIATRIKKFDHKHVKLPVPKWTKQSKDSLLFYAHHSFDRMMQHFKENVHPACYHVNAWKWEQKNRLN